MRRLLRILLNTATALSVVGCVLSALLWTRSYWRTDIWRERSVGVTPDTPAGWYVLRSRVHAFTLFTGRASLYREVDEPRRTYISAQEAARLTRVNQCTYSCSNSPRPRSGDETPHFALYHKSQGSGVLFPLWVPTAAFALLPSIRLIARWRRRPPAGHCPDCGYDLRATPDRCPECGAVPTPPPPPA
jgi:hypothetical protein